MATDTETVIYERTLNPSTADNILGNGHCESRTGNCILGPQGDDSGNMRMVVVILFQKPTNKLLGR
jgi:hypothetical protein